VHPSKASVFVALVALLASASLLPASQAPSALASGQPSPAAPATAATVAAGVTGPTGPAGTTGPTGTTGPSGPPAPAPESPTLLTRLPDNAILDGSVSLTVTLSAPVASSSPAPMLTPTVAGTWKTVGDSEIFTPASTLEPCSDYTLTVWAGTLAVGHTPLGKRRTVALRVACPPVAGLQQALARLGYLGARFRPRYGVHLPVGRLSRRQAAAAAFHPPRGLLAPDPADAPPVQLGRSEAVTFGALEVFQADRGLPVTGQPDSRTWDSLLYDQTAGSRDPRPYAWVRVTETLPETLFLHRGDRLAFTTPVNTGVAGAETALGIFPIYARYVSTSMAGEDPDGTKYDVPDVPWVNYFNGGDAVHGYPRASYGFPQSNGCIELPIEAARTVFGMLQIGDIVEVSG
jgi:hypothetical protein